MPDNVHASPVDVVPGPDANNMWWRPGWSDVARALGWRWLLLVPLMGVVALFAAGLAHPRLLGWFWWLGFKWLVMLAAVPVVLAGDVIRKAAAARKEPFCIHCGYTLTGLPAQGTCPECGSGYSPRLIAEYRRDPHWFVQRYKSRGQIPPPQAPFNAGPVTARRRSKDGT